MGLNLRGTASPTKFMANKVLCNEREHGVPSKYNSLFKEDITGWFTGGLLPSYRTAIKEYVEILYKSMENGLHLCMVCGYGLGSNSPSYILMRSVSMTLPHKEQVALLKTIFPNLY